MDANKQTFWMLADGTQFDFSTSSTGCVWDDHRRILRLSSQSRPRNLPINIEEARACANKSPFTLDGFDTWATTSEDRSQVIASGAFNDPVVIYTAPAGQQIMDLSMSDEGVLYIAEGVQDLNASIVMLDRRGRWLPVILNEEGFIPDRIVAVPGGDAWALDRAHGRLAQVKGEPLRNLPRPRYCPGMARPCEENSDPPRLIMRNDLIFPPGREIIAMAANLLDQVAFLLWADTGQMETEILLLEENKFKRHVCLADSGAPFSLGWVEGERWALLCKDFNEALVYQISQSSPALRIKPVGDHYPLIGWANRPFCNALTQPVYYSADRDREIIRPWPLHRLSLPTYACSAEVMGKEPFDSAHPGTVWHRIYLEASLPPKTGVKIYLSSADDIVSLEDEPEMEHRFGSIPTTDTDDDIPLGTWVDEASEIPYHPGFLPCQREKDRTGLFTVLVQRSGRVVRTLAGRYLRVRIELLGTSHASPEIAALRVYAPRFSYLDRYLPELYRETKSGDEADAMEPATGPDFLQRFLGIFEGILTPLEDKVATAYLVTDPASAPPEALDWLAAWIGLTLESSLSEMRKRRMIAAATRLFRKRGTLRGLSGALNIATDNKVALGKIVILEDFRLRRTFATILGADLSDEENPLLMGLVSSGNSYVGDTLFLGEEEKKEFLALYKPGIAATENEQERVERFLEELAHRITILVHQEMTVEELQLVRRVAELESPAHVAVRLISASKPLMVGLSALIGVDTYLGEPLLPEPVEIGKTSIGRRDFIQGIASLDPRLEEAAAPMIQPGMRRPIAHISADEHVNYNSSFILDGSGSRAFGTAKIVSYIWKRLS